MRTRLKPNGEKGKVLSLRMGFEGLGRLMMTSTARAGFNGSEGLALTVAAIIEGGEGVSG
jgi:hypothetical protein